MGFRCIDAPKLHPYWPICAADANNTQAVQAIEGGGLPIVGGGGGNHVFVFDKVDGSWGKAKGIQKGNLPGVGIRKGSPTCGLVCSRKLG